MSLTGVEAAVSAAEMCGRCIVCGLDKFAARACAVATFRPHTIVSPDSEASVAPAAPAGTHHVWSPTIPSTWTPRSCW
jgi:hypothetical protein